MEEMSVITVEEMALWDDDGLHKTKTGNDFRDQNVLKFEYRECNCPR